MRIAIAGGTGRLGRVLVASLEASGHEVVVLRRGQPTRGRERQWDPAAGRIFGPGLSDVDAVINLAGETLAQRWTADARERIHSSRMTSTLTIVAALEPDGRCRRLLNGSSTAIYGDSGDDIMDTDSPVWGGGFLARMCVEWEASANHSPVPTVLMRLGHVLCPDNGYLGDQRAFFRAGFGGYLGTGRQWVPWIHVADWVAAVDHLLTSGLEGPVNVTAPEPVRQREFARALGRALGRPSGLPWPKAVVAARFGRGMAEEVLYASVRAVPQQLQEHGFRFRHPAIGPALDDLLAG